MWKAVKKNTWNVKGSVKLNRTAYCCLVLRQHLSNTYKALFEKTMPVANVRCIKGVFAFHQIGDGGRNKRLTSISKQRGD